MGIGKLAESSSADLADNVPARPLDSGFGLELTDFNFDARALAGAEQLRALLAHRQVLVFRDQILSPEQFSRIGRIFGTPILHVLSRYRHEKVPGILLLSNELRNGVPLGVHDGAAYWHTDNSYEDPPARATLLLCKRAPATGGDTLIADMIRAYRDLSEAEREHLDGLSVFHEFGNRDCSQGRTAALPVSEAQERAVSRVRHPLVMEHPLTGQKALYAVSGSSVSVCGYLADEGLALLRRLTSHSTSPRYLYRHRYRPGDLLIFDTLSTMHSATLLDPTTRPSEVRALQRISVS